MNKKYHYVYRITNTKINKHYYGTRSSRIEPSKDIGVKYFSSSSDVSFRDDQNNNPQNYKYTIVSEFDSRESAVELEVALHIKFDVGVNESFYNKAKQTSTGFDAFGIKRTKQQVLNWKKSYNKSGGGVGELNGMSGMTHSDASKELMSLKRNNSNVVRSKPHALFIFYKNNVLIKEVIGQKEARNFCRNHDISYQSLCKSSDVWKEWYCNRNKRK
tara:strand:+ start:213 stop:860 length:648 start_codon:yes stop_codon:yes gene_type:complete